MRLLAATADAKQLVASAIDEHVTNVFKDRAALARLETLSRQSTRCRPGFGKAHPWARCIRFLMPSVLSRFCTWLRKPNMRMHRNQNLQGSTSSQFTLPLCFEGRVLGGHLAPQAGCNSNSKFRLFTPEHRIICKGCGAIPWVELPSRAPRTRCRRKFMPVSDHRRHGSKQIQAASQPAN